MYEIKTTVNFIPWLKNLDGCLTNDDCDEGSFCDVDINHCEDCHPYGGDAIDCDNLDENTYSLAAKKMCNDECEGLYFHLSKKFKKILNLNCFIPNLRLWN